MPLTHRAKLVMALQAKASLAVLGLVIARAVNIVKLFAPLSDRLGARSLWVSLVSRRR